MMKKYFFLAFAATAIFAFTNCSSDDDKDNNKVVLPIPTNAQYAATYTLGSPLQPFKSQSSVDDPQLTSIDVTEDNMLILELRKPKSGKKTYVSDKVKFDEKGFFLNGNNIKGTIVPEAATRALELKALSLNLTVTLPEGDVLEFATEDKIDVSITVSNLSDVTTTNLCRTWNIRGAMVDVKVKGDKNVQAFASYSAKNGVFDLNEVKEEMIKRGVALTSKEEADFNRQIKNIAVTKNGTFVIVYADNTMDKATWTWKNSDKTSFNICFAQMDDMGNKLLNNNSTFSLAYKGTMCNMEVDAAFQDTKNKSWEGSLILQLQADN